MGRVADGKKDYRKRVALPKGKEAEEELARIRRNERRAERREKRRLAKTGEFEESEAEEGQENIPPVKGVQGHVKTPEELRAEFSMAFDELGGTAGLVAWGRRYPKEFYAIWARLCIPKAVIGDDGGGGSLESMLAQLDNGEVGV